MAPSAYSSHFISPPLTESKSNETTPPANNGCRTEFFIQEFEAEKNMPTRQIIGPPETEELRFANATPNDFDLLGHIWAAFPCLSIFDTTFEFVPIYICVGWLLVP